MKFKSINELLEYTENIKGKTFREIDSQNLLENTTNLMGNKGILGHVVESGFYKYPINSNPQADFDEIGVELKVTGYKKSKKGVLSAKERVSLSKIDYHGIVNEEYDFSKLISKNKKILFIWYEYEKEKDIGDFLITDYQLYDMGQDEDIIRNDFYLIKQKVCDGLAHELSEGDTSYLGACTKARTSKDRTSQPYSSIMAKPRAYSLKNSYMTGILRSIGHDDEIPISPELEVEGLSALEDFLNSDVEKSDEELRLLEKFINPDIFNTNENEFEALKGLIYNEGLKDADVIEGLKSLDEFVSLKIKDSIHRYKTVEEYVYDKIKDYIGKSQLDILHELTGKTYEDNIPKNINKMITDALIGKDKELPEKDDLFAKTNFIIKNLPLTKRGKARERMAFRNLRLSEFEEEWDDSDWKAYFEEVTLLVILWREPDSSCRNGYRVLDGVKKISFDDDDLRSFEISYLMVRETILNQDTSLLPTPNSFDGQYLVVAPKGQKGDDAYNNFFKKDTTKVTFMLTKEFLNEKLA